MGFRGILAIGALLFGVTSANAQIVGNPPVYGPTQLDPASYNPRNLPVIYQAPTNKIPNVAGRSIQNACIRSGRAAATCGSIAVGAGGAGVGWLMDMSWADAGSVALSGVIGAGEAAILGCAGGAAMGAMAAGAGALPGCLAGAIGGAIYGGYGGVKSGLMNLTEDGAVAIDKATGQLVGAGVSTTTKTQVATPTDALSVNTAYWGNGAYNQHLALYGVGREMVLKDSLNGYRRGIIVGYTIAPNGTYQSTLGDVVTASQLNAQRSASNMGVCTATNVCSSAVGLWTAAGTATSGCSYNAGCILFYNSVSHQAPNQVVTYQHSPINPVGPGAMGFGPNIQPSQLPKPVPAETIAAIVQAALQEYGKRTGQNLSDIVVNGGDVTKVYQDDPTARIQLQDLIKGIANNAARGGTNEQPLNEPQQAIVTNPVGPGTPVQPGNGNGSQPSQDDTDLELTAGIAVGNPIQPVVDFLSGPLAPFLSPTFDGVQGQCPIWEVDMREWFGPFLERDLYDQAIEQTSVHAKARSFLAWDSQKICEFTDQHYQTIQLVCSVMLLISAVVWFFE